MLELNKLYNCCCMEGMAQFPDNYFELAIVDPPYGINMAQMHMGSRKTSLPDKSKRWDDETPDDAYFCELRRVSRNQIIWGGNYFPLPPTRCFVVWDKGETMYGRSFAECEAAWTSFDASARIFKRSPNNIARIHPCLPAGERVFIGNKWKKIEDVGINEKTNYGIVSAVTTHVAGKIITLNTESGTTQATNNHPFLVKRGSKILWIEAEQISRGDCLLINSSLPLKDMSGVLKMENSKCTTSKYTRNITENCRMDSRYITSMGTRPTIELKTSWLSTPLHINGCTEVANIVTENGISLVRPAEKARNVLLKIGIYQGGALTEKNVNLATQREGLKSDKFVLNKVESVAIQERNTTVYNLSIDGVPAFDTTIGVSHNTQKPAALYRWLLKNYAKPGDKILDTHAGSASSLIAAYEMGHDYIGFEIDPDYHAEASKRVAKVMAQGRLFDAKATNDYKAGHELPMPFFE